MSVLRRSSGIHLCSSASVSKKSLICFSCAHHFIERLKSTPNTHPHPSSSPVGLSGEDPQDGRSAVDLQHVRQRLQDIEVEEGVAGDGAVQPSFEERGPVAFQDPRRSAVVVLTNPGDSGENHLVTTGRGTLIHSLASFQSALKRGREVRALTLPRAVYSTAISLKKK